jgi:hypothetical protein
VSPAPKKFKTARLLAKFSGEIKDVVHQNSCLLELLLSLRGIVG